MKVAFYGKGYVIGKVGIHDKADLFVAVSLESVRDYLTKTWPDVDPEDCIGKLNSGDAAYVEFPPKSVNCTSVRVMPLLLREGVDGQIDFCLAQLGREDLNASVRESYEKLLNNLIKCRFIT